MKHFRAFTLPELLVVIGIIAILMAILIPTLSRARNTARTAACAANLRGMGQSLVLYVNNHRYYPGGLWYNNDYNTPSQGSKATYVCCLWAPRLNAEVGHGARHLFKCPSAPSQFIWNFLIPKGRPAEAKHIGAGYQLGDSLLLATPTLPSDASRSGFPFENWDSYNFTYGYNSGGWIFGNNSAIVPPEGLGLGHWSYERGPYRELRAATVKKPQEMIAIGDFGIEITDPGPLPMFPYNLYPIAATMIGPFTGAVDKNGRWANEVSGDLIGNRHKKADSKGINILFADGHVGWFRSVDINSTAPPPYRRLWNNTNEAP